MDEIVLILEMLSKNLSHDSDANQLGSSATASFLAAPLNVLLF
jgi:hypothetical protein